MSDLKNILGPKVREMEELHVVENLFAMFIFQKQMPKMPYATSHRLLLVIDARYSKVKVKKKSQKCALINLRKCFKVKKMKMVRTYLKLVMFLSTIGLKTGLTILTFNVPTPPLHQTQEEEAMV
jgi:hypothetical protein